MQLPLSSLIIIAFLLALVVSAVLWKAIKRKRLLKNNPRPHKVAPAANAKVSLSDTDSGQPSNSSTAPSPSFSSAVEATDILDEIEIYLSYGHLEQAATSLNWYVTHHPADVVQGQKLLTLYQEIPDMDRFAELLTSLFDSRSLSTEEVENHVISGLKADPDNLQLLVLAENLGISHARLAANASNSSANVPKAASPALMQAQQKLQQVLVHPEPLDMDLSGFSEKPLQGVQRHDHSEIIGTSGQLLQGNAAIESISSKECDICIALADPLVAIRALLVAGQVQDAERLLKRQLIFDPRKLVLHVMLLDIYHQQQRCHNYAEALLQLYISLWGAGAALRERMLKIGRKMGEHSLWDPLIDSETNKSLLAEQAEKYGLYLPLTAIPLSTPALVLEEIHRDHQITPKDSDDSVLEEFDSLLEYGQVEEAVDLLEKATLARPDHKLYYRPLLEMYERMGAHERFSRFTQAILDLDKAPDEEIMRQMFSLAERMQRQPQRQVI